MSNLVKDHFELSLEIAKMDRKKMELGHKIMDELIQEGEHRYFSVNWTRLYRERIQRSIRELRI